MTGIRLEIEVDDHEMLELLTRMTANLGNLRPFHASVGEHMMNSIEDRFDTETAPDDSSWTALAPATVANRLRNHGNAELTILREEGHLAGSFNYEAGSENVTIGTAKVYAAIQHFGGEAGRGHAVTIPARPVLGLSADDKVEIHNIAEDFLLG